MGLQSLRTPFIASLLLVGCSVAPTNPYDPASTDPARARVSGRLVSLSGTALVDAFVTFSSDRGGHVPIPVSPEGAFSAELLPGVWSLEAGAKGHFPSRLTGVRLEAGVREDIGTLRLEVVRGVVSGRVRLEGGGSPLGALVALVPSEGSTQAWTATAGPTGEYSVFGVPEGEYVARVSHDDYAPTYSEAHAITGEGTTVVPDLTLQPASAVVRVEVDGRIGARFTKDGEVRVLLLAFGDVVREMQLSEDPAFADPGKGDVEWRQYTASTDVVLAGDDGERVLWAKFRDRWGIESPAFSTSVVLDRTPPVITGTLLGDGTGWVTATATLTPLVVEATDALSGIAALAVATDGLLDTEAEELREAPPGPVVLTTGLALGTAEGPRSVVVRVRDAAGNVSEEEMIPVVIDATAPRTASPSILVEGGAAVVHAREVSLSFDVTGDAPDEPLFVALANGPGLPDQPPTTPLPTGAFPWLLADGSDGLRTVCARFGDAAGNTTEEQCVDVTLDRTGVVAGRVDQESAGTTLAGATVTITSDVDPGFSRVATTADDGSFEVRALPAGEAYVARFALAGFFGETRRPVIVRAGRTTLLESVRLRRARGSVSGLVTLNDAAFGEHGGIVVSAVNTPHAATTTPTGAFLLRDLPVGTYEIQAQATGYQPGSFGTVTVTADHDSALGSLQLRRQSGSFSFCRAGDDTCTQGPVTYTGSRDVLLRLSSTTATQFRAATTPDLSGATFQPLEEGRTTYPFELEDREGEQAVFVEYRTATGDVQPVVSASVTLDRTPPTGLTVVIDPDEQGRGAGWSRHPTGQVRLALAANDALSGVASVIVSNEDAVFDEAPVVFAPFVAHRVEDAVDGLKTVYVRACDRVGNCTPEAEAVVATIRLDRVAPSVTEGYAMQLSGGATVTASAQVSVELSLGADAAAVRFGSSPTLAGAQWLAVDPAVSTTVGFSLLLPLGDGAKTVYAQFADAAGNVSSLDPAAFSAVIELDTVAPQAPRALVAGNGYTNLAHVDVGTGAVGATEMQVLAGVTEDFTGASWEPVATTRRLALASDGVWRIFARYRDAAGNVSSTATAQIIRDTVAPTAAGVEVVEGAWAQTQQVNLRLFASGADEMRISSDGTFDAEPWEPYATARAFSLVPVGASPYTVRVLFRDLAGNVSTPATATVSVDDVAPTVALLLDGVASGARTNTPDVIATVNASDNVGVTEMELSNNPTFAGASRVRWSSTMPWRLDASGADGLRSVYVRVFDASGRSATATASITLDRAAPSGTVAFAEGTRTKSRQVTLQLTRDADVASVAFGNGALDCGGATYEAWPLSGTKAWQLPAGDGSKTVVACFRDEAGNASTSSATIVLDETPPVALATPAVRVNGGATRATSVTVSLRFLVSGADTMRVSCDDALDSEPSQAFQAELSCSLNPIQGTRTVTASFADLAGNTLGPVSATIVLDTLPPPAPVAAVLSSPTNAAALNLAWTSGGGDTDRFRVQVAASPDFAAPTVDATVAASPSSTPVLEGTWYWRVAALDVAGNQSAWSSTGAVRVDRTAPSTPSLKAEASSGSSIDVQWYAPGDDRNELNLAPGSYYELRWAAGKAASFDFATATNAVGEPVPAPRGTLETFRLSGLTPKTTYTVALRTCDAAGNCSASSVPVSEVTRDDVPPAAITDLAGTVGDHSVTLRWTHRGDDGTGGGPVARVIVWYRDGPLSDEADFALAQPFTVAPGTPGSPGEITVSGLRENTRYSFAVRSYDFAGNDSGSSNVVTLQLTSIAEVRPAAAAPGDWVELDGINFGATNAVVSFNGVAATNVAVWTNTLVRVQVPAHASSGLVRIVRGVLESDGAPFTIGPAVTSVYPREVVAGGTLYLSGGNFGARTDPQTGISFGSTFVSSAELPDWQDGGASLTVPSTLTPGVHQARVRHLGADSRAHPVRVWAPPFGVENGTTHLWGAASSPTDGTLHVIYSSTSGSSTSLRTRRLLANTNVWDGPIDPNGSAMAGARGYDIDVDGNGTAHYCWIRHTISGTTHTATLYYRNRTSANIWGPLRQLRTASASGLSPPIDSCRVAASTQGGAGTAAVLVVWTEGYWQSVTAPSRLWGRASVDGGVNFAAETNICPGGGCVANVFEGLPDVAAVNSRYVRGWHLVYGRKTGVSGTIDLRVAYSAVGTPATPFNFTGSVSAASGLRGIADPTLATVDAWLGWEPVSSTVLAWNDGSHTFSQGTVWLLPLEGGTFTRDFTPEEALVVDETALGGYRPTLAANTDGDLSVFVVGTQELAGTTDNVVRHHLFRWTEGGRPRHEGGEELVGVQAKAPVHGAAGADGRVALAWAQSGTGVGISAIRASWSRLPRVDGTPKTIVAAPGSTNLTSPKSTIAADGTIHTTYWEQTLDGALTLRAVRESPNGALSQRATPLGSGQISGSVPWCDESSTCDDLTALATRPNGSAAALFSVPTGGTRSLFFCADLMACTPQTLATGLFGGVALAADARGTLHLVYERSTFPAGIFYRSWNDDVLGPEVRVNGLASGHAEPGFASLPRVVATPAGTAFVFYRRAYGLNTVRVRSLSRSAASSEGVILGEPAELAASSAALDALSVALGSQGIEVAWREGGSRVRRGRWLDGWLVAPTDVAVLVGKQYVTALADPNGQAWLYLDSNSSEQYDRFASALDLDRVFATPISLGARSFDSRGFTAASIDPRGRLVLHGTNCEFGFCSDLIRFTHAANEW